MVSWGWPKILLEQGQRRVCYSRGQRWVGGWGQPWDPLCTRRAGKAPGLEGTCWGSQGGKSQVSGAIEGNWSTLSPLKGPLPSPVTPYSVIFTFLHPRNPCECEHWFSSPPALDSVIDLLWTHQTCSTRQTVNLPAAPTFKQHPHTHCKRKRSQLQVTQKLSHLLVVLLRVHASSPSRPTAQLGVKAEMSLPGEKFNEGQGRFFPDMNAATFVLKFFSSRIQIFGYIQTPKVKLKATHSLISCRLLWTLRLEWIILQTQLHIFFFLSKTPCEFSM